MSQGSHVKHPSYSSSSNSSSQFSNAVPSRRYATLEESEAVLPVFTTPTNMYLRQEYNPQPRYAASPNPQSRYTPSPNPQNNPNHSRSQAFDPLYTKNSSTSSPISGFASPQHNKPKDEPRQPYRDSSNSTPSPSTRAKDEMVAQLVDMGFDTWQARVAVDATNGKSLQEALDLLLQNQQAEKETNRSSDEDEEQWRKQQEERKQDYLNEINRQKSSPQSSFNSTPLKPTPYTDPIMYANNERKQGNFAFNKGQIPESEKLYTHAINALPAGHGDLVLLLNNRAAAYLKQNKFQECLKDSSLSIDIAKRNLNMPVTPIMQEAGTNMKAQFLKALHRKACAFEGLRMYKDAIQVYEEYIQLDGSRNPQVIQGLQRCQQASGDGTTWKPANGSETAFPNIDISIFMKGSKSQLSQAEIDEINNSKAVKEMRDREKKKEAEEAERLMKEDQVNARISAWKAGKERNLRALLSSLESILWSGVQWKPVASSDIIDAKKCKVTYMKAIAKVHPDKLPANATVEQRMLASGVFTILNQAWDIFKTENNL